jgi:hypothetical protein
MFLANSPQIDTDAFMPADTLLDEAFFDPEADDYLDRCLFDLRTAVSDFRNA